MELGEIKQKVNDIIYEVLRERINYEDITPEKHLIEDLGAESSETLEIFLTIMSDFDIEIDRNSIMNLANINDLYLCVEKLVRQEEKV